ncbi:unnamed protein product, partial [Pylaiella littoralis]
KSARLSNDPTTHNHQVYTSSLLPQTLNDVSAIPEPACTPAPLRRQSFIFSSSSSAGGWLILCCRSLSFRTIHRCAPERQGQASQEETRLHFVFPPTANFTRLGAVKGVGEITRYFDTVEYLDPAHPQSRISGPPPPARKPTPPVRVGRRAATSIQNASVERSPAATPALPPTTSRTSVSQLPLLPAAPFLNAG